MDATEEGEQTRSTAGCAFTLREWRSKAVKDFPARHLYTSTARHLYTSTLVLGYLGNRLQCRAGFRCGNRDVLRFRQMLDLLHGVAGQARHAPPRGGVVPHQPEHLVQQNTFLRTSPSREQRKPWVVLELEAVKAASDGRGGWDKYITCDIIYMIYHQTLLVVHAYDIIVLAYDITYTI